MTTTPQTIINLGTGGTGLNAMNGSTAGADSNDSKFLEWPGDNRGNYVYLPGTASNSMTLADAAPLRVTTDFDIRVWAALDSWSSGNIQRLAGRYSTAGNRSYLFDLTAGGTLRLTTSADGTTLIIYTASVSTGFTAGAAKWVRVTFDADNGTGNSVAKFWSSDDGVSWTQMGTDRTGAVTSIFAGTAAFGIGIDASNTNPATGAFYRTVVYSDLTETTKVLDVDTSVITAGTATSFTELSSNAATVTINRSTSGRKTVAVVSPVHLFGTDDYWEIADNALLDFTASQSFTIVAVHRPWATQGTNDVLAAKKANTTATTAGWSLTGGSSTALQGQGQIGDGTKGTTAVSASRTAGALTVTATVRNVSADTLTTYLNGTAGTPVSDATTASLANSEVVRIGRLSGAGTEYLDAELFAVAVFRRALSASEIASITSYYQARLS